MATFLLDGRSTAALPNRPLAATLATSTGVRTGVRLQARYADGAPAQAVQPSPTVIILPRVDREITLIAVPDGRVEFTEGMVLHLSVGPEDTRQGDGDRVQVAPREVSGLALIELATIAPGAAGSLVVASKVAAPDQHLPPLAAQARVAARGVLGVDHEPADRARPVTVVVDRSASMAALFASGAVAAAGDLVAGIAAVIGAGDAVRLLDAAGAGAPATGREVGLAELGDALAPGRSDGAFGIGARTPSGTSAGLTVLITDGPGGALAAAEPRSGTVVLALTDAPSIARRPGFAGALCPPPGPGEDGRQALGNRPGVVRNVVTALLQGSGTAAAR